MLANLKWLKFFLYDIIAIMLIFLFVYSFIYFFIDISFLLQPGRSPGIQMCLRTPGIDKIIIIMFSRRLAQCCISFLVQPGRSPGIQMCLSAPGIYNRDNNHL